MFFLLKYNIFFHTYIKDSDSFYIILINVHIKGYSFFLTLFYSIYVYVKLHFKLFKMGFVFSAIFPKTSE